MNIIGLIEMHPFDGNDPFVCLRVQNRAGAMFDLPINEEQLQIIVANQPVNSAPEEHSEEEESAYDYEPTNASFNAKPDQDVTVVPARQYSVGHNASWDEDDDL